VLAVLEAMIDEIRFTEAARRRTRKAASIAG